MVFVFKVACGHAFNIALDDNGKVYTWGFGKLNSFNYWVTVEKHEMAGVSMTFRNF